MTCYTIRSWNIEFLSIDENLQPHGPCKFFLIGTWQERHEYESGKHNFLNWSIKEIYGQFNHGKLNGIAKLVTWQSQIIFATFKDGILHGPAIVHGTTPIIDQNVSCCLIV